METTIIINEQHKLLPEQQDILTETFGEWTTILVPATGWNKQYRDSLCKLLTGNIVFVSNFGHDLRFVCYSSFRINKYWKIIS